MNNSGPRQLFFVCAAVIDNELIMKTISSSSEEDAKAKFAEQFFQSPKEICGPFFKKRAVTVNTNISLKFTNQIRKAVYNNWVVNAFILEEPKDKAYLVFLKREDGKKMPIPNGTITVPLSELRMI